MSEEVPGHGCHYSDHDGVEAVLELCYDENRAPSPTRTVSDGESNKFYIETVFTYNMFSLKGLNVCY